MGWGGGGELWRPAGAVGARRGVRGGAAFVETVGAAPCTCTAAVEALHA